MVGLQSGLSAMPRRNPLSGGFLGIANQLEKFDLAFLNLSPASYSCLPQKFECRDIGLRSLTTIPLENDAPFPLSRLYIVGCDGCAEGAALKLVAMQKMAV
jgi:hypothetical protein